MKLDEQRNRGCLELEKPCRTIDPHHVEKGETLSGRTHHQESGCPHREKKDGGVSPLVLGGDSRLNKGHTSETVSG